MLYYLSRRRLPHAKSNVGKMMKKAHTIQQLKMCQSFAAVGEDVCFASPRNGTQSPSWEVISEYYGLSSRFDLKAIPTPSKNYRFPNYPVPDTDTQLGTFWLLYTYLSGGFDEGDIVYSRNLAPTRYFLQFLEWIDAGDGISVWFEQHQVDRGLDEKFVGDDSVFYEQLDGVVCISNVLKEQLVENHPIEPEKVIVAHDGVDLQVYDGLSTETARERLGFDTDESIVMYTGHLYPSKDVDTLVQAAADFDASCYIVGGYPEDISRIEAEVTVPDNVTFTGFVPPSEIPLYQTAADVLVATVAEDPEMDYFSPLKLFEYMAAGKPIVVSQKPEYEEVLTHAKTTLFVEPGSVAGLAEAVETLRSDPRLSAELGRKARENAERYDWNVRAQNVLRAIRGYH